MNGRAEGSVRSNHLRRSLEQNDLATSSSPGSASLTPRVVLISTGKTANRKTITIFAHVPNPNHRTSTGTSATIGVA